MEPTIIVGALAAVLYVECGRAYLREMFSRPPRDEADLADILYRQACAAAPWWSAARMARRVALVTFILTWPAWMAAAQVLRAFNVNLPRY